MINLDDRLLDDLDHFEYWVLSHLAKRLPNIHPSLKTIVKDTKLSKSKVALVLNSLESGGIIVRNRNTNGTSYEITSVYKIQKFNGDSSLSVRNTTCPHCGLSLSVRKTYPVREKDLPCPPRGHKVLGREVLGREVLTNQVLRNGSGKNPYQSKIQKQYPTTSVDEEGVKILNEFDALFREYSPSTKGTIPQVIWNKLTESCNKLFLNPNEEIHKLIPSLKNLIQAEKDAIRKNEALPRAEQKHIPAPCGFKKYFEEGRWTQNVIEVKVKKAPKENGKNMEKARQITSGFIWKNFNLNYKFQENDNLYLKYLICTFRDEVGNGGEELLLALSRFMKTLKKEDFLNEDDCTPLRMYEIRKTKTDDA